MSGSRPRAGSRLRAAPLLIAVAVLAACAADGDGAGGPVPYVAEFALGEDAPEAREFVLVPGAEPDGRPAVGLPAGPSVAWVDGGRYLGVVTAGSSSCPHGPYGIEVVGEQEIDIRLGPLFPGRDPCSADVRTHVTVVEPPEGITPARPLVARFGDRDVALEAVDR